ncbi:uncharacterized protein N7487_003674 [Penicillium crustosum]|uniref:uncharacterized protein n=1 Tax=Penicillium crustosum TaxID=36656 RepID=UPI0023A091BD|nr:uncharacterized protein N7487_003674 [Penicillium crustosum]KAJ5409315.1 hypothetical protein N7487_003674 [Penicillium crustosum]
MSLPEIIFSGYSIGTPLTTAGEVQKVLDQLKEMRIHRIDTAALWPRASPGCSEMLLGEVKTPEQGFKVDTRISPVTVSSSAPRGDRNLTGPAIKKSLQESLGRLHTNQIHVLYFHHQDRSTPIGEQAAAMQEQYTEGRFDKFGLCNFNESALKAFMLVCKNKGYVKPTVYQSWYNLASRENEKLFPLLRRHGIAFHACSTFSRFMTGRRTSSEGIWHTSTYDNPNKQAGIMDFRETIKKFQLSEPEACLRWIYYHSKMQKGDGVILEASSAPELAQHIKNIAKGPLPAENVKELDLLYKRLRGW